MYLIEETQNKLKVWETNFWKMEKKMSFYKAKVRKIKKPKSGLNKCQQEIMKADQICKRENQLKVQMIQLKHVSSSKTVCCSYYHMVRCEREMISCENYRRILDFTTKQKYFDVLSMCKYDMLTPIKLLELV